MMKFALNHPWKFADGGLAFRAGFLQVCVVFCLEFANIFVLIKAKEIFDVIKDFIAFMVIADFDDILFTAMNQDKLAMLISGGQVSFDGFTVSLSELIKIETTSKDYSPSSSPQLSA